MQENIKKILSFTATLPVLTLSCLSAEEKEDVCTCPQDLPAPCAVDNCRFLYCLGPENTGVNAPVRPKTCNGDIFITAAGFYWNAHQDGLEYAIKNNAVNPNSTVTGTPLTPPTTMNIEAVNVLNKATFLNPASKWNFGFKVGIGYNSMCDGWDFGALWTRFKETTSRSNHTTLEETKVLLPLWSAWANTLGSILYASSIDHSWTLDLNLVDVELGREFWTSKYVSLRPFIGVRVGFFDQKVSLDYAGGAWDAFAASFSSSSQSAYMDHASYKNNFKAIGIRGGLDSVWNFGWGWGVYGNLAASILYGRFSIEAREHVALSTAPYTKTPVLETSNSFHSSKTALDLGLGVQWAAQFCACKYGLVAMLGWENHLFFEQNQMWRVVRANASTITALGNFDASGNPQGQNIFTKNSGDLSTQGWTLTLRFEF